MYRFIEWLSFAAALLSLALNVVGSGAHNWITALAASSLFLSSLQFVFEPKRALFVLTFLLSLPVLVSIFSLYPIQAAESALVAVAFALQARLVFLKSARRAQGASHLHAEALRSCLPEKGNVFVDMDIEGECATKEMQEGHLVRIRPGDSLPVDGQLTFGSSFVDEATLTGDREPRTKSMGSFVLAGSKNKNGSFIFRASGSARQSFLHRLASGLERGFPLESIWGKPLLLLEGLTFAGSVLVYLFSGPHLAPLLNVFLVSMGTAAGAALWSADSRFLLRSAKRGFWWKSKWSARKLADTGMLLSGRAGVLTEGRQRLAATEGVADLSEDGALRLIGPLARRLENEVAFALLQEMQTRNIRLELMDAYLELPGGASGIVAGEDVRWVDLETARLEGLPFARVEAFVAEHLRAGEKIHLLFRGSQVAATLAFSDRILPDAGPGIARLRRAGIPFLLVAAESEIATRRLREELGIEHVCADAGHEEARGLLEKLESEGLRPLWLASPGWSVAGGVIPSFLLPSLGREAEAVSASGDVLSIAELLGMARKYVSRSRRIFWIAGSAELLLLAACPFLDPRLAAFLGLICGLLITGKE